MLSAQHSKTIWSNTYLMILYDFEIIEHLTERIQFRFYETKFQAQSSSSFLFLQAHFLSLPGQVKTLPCFKAQEILSQCLEYDWHSSHNFSK